MSRISSRLLFVASTLLGCVGQANAQTYTFTDLFTPAGGSSSASAINDLGQIAGSTFFDPSVSAVTHATVWTGSAATDLGTLGGSDSFGSGINNAGQVVGSSYGVFDMTRGPVLWTGGQPVWLGGGSGSSAYAINNFGVAAGSALVPYTGATQFHATLWTGSTAADLGTLGGDSSSANAINDVGQTAGRAQTHNNAAYHAVLWNGTTQTDLGTLGGTNSSANGINNAGQVVGEAEIAGSLARHAALWNGGSVTDLGTLGGTYSWAAAVNDHSQIVGSAATANGFTHATLWSGNDAIAIDLNGLLDSSTVADGWVLTQANDINENGWIVGVASNELLGVQHAFLLTPSVPEPESYALMLAGLCLVGWAAKRKAVAN